MATYLQLSQNVARDSGTVSGTNPTSVANQSGRLNEIVQWVADAWVLVQEEHDGRFRFMRKEFSGKEITNPTLRYTGAGWSLSNFANWVPNSVSIYKQSDGQALEGDPLPWVSWTDWRKRWLIGTHNATTPTEIAVSPANELCFGATPDTTYIAQGEYWRTPQVLAANGDIPICPARFHKVIEHRAMMTLRSFDEDLVGYAEAQRKYNEVMFSMELSELPQVTVASEPLA